MEMLNLLATPSGHESLYLKNDTLVSENGECFPQKFGVWQFLDTLDSPHQEHYEKDALVFDYFAGAEIKAQKHEILRLHQTIYAGLLKESKTVLDIGCGEGWVAKTGLPQGKRVISLDLSSKNTEEVARRYPSARHLVLRADALRLPIKSSSLDCVIASEVLEHIPTPHQFLSECLRVLRPGGRAILTTPYAEKIQYCLCIHCNQKTPLHAHLHSIDEEFVDHLMKPWIMQCTYRFHTFLNKPLVLLQSHKLLSKLNYPIWKKIDALANRIVRKPSRVLWTIDKK